MQIYLTAFLYGFTINQDMDLNDNAGVSGSIHGLYHGQHDRVDELNSRLVGRQFPDHAMQPNYSPRPVSTKYAHFPMLEGRVKPTVSEQNYVQYDPHAHFSTATTRGPVRTYLANVDIETMLQNRHISLQHGADQGVYVPSSSSNMYGFSAVGRHEPLGDRALLFKQHSLATTLPEIVKHIGNDRFNNNTRTQLRGI
jgi:hypothetical protein